MSVPSACPGIGPCSPDQQAVCASPCGRCAVKGGGGAREVIVTLSVLAMGKALFLHNNKKDQR